MADEVICTSPSGSEIFDCIQMEGRVSVHVDDWMALKVYIQELSGGEF